MAKAEVGTPKYIANKMKARGLQRLRWYCQVCEKQCRDENGFKCHTQSESHVRKMLSVGENAKKSIEEFSRQFKHDFLLLLRTSHGEKPINANRFYQEYISNKEHIHMNATKWHSLNEFVKYLGREGICRVSNDEDAVNGLTIAWIDKSPEALKRHEALRKREMGERGEELRRQLELERQVKEAQRKAAEKKDETEQQVKTDLKTELKRDQPLSLRLSLKKKTEEQRSVDKMLPNVTNRVFQLGGPKVTKPVADTKRKPLSVFERVMLKDQGRNAKRDTKTA